MRLVEWRYSMFLKPRLATGLVVAMLLSLLAACGTQPVAPTVAPSTAMQPSRVPSPTNTSPLPTNTPVSPTAIPTPIPAPGRAVWVWQSQVVTDTVARKDFLDFAGSKSLTAAYIHAYSLLPGQELALQEFLTMAGLQVELLAGDPSWALPEGHNNVLSFVRAVVTFIQTLKPGTNLVGVHLDVEPYVLPEWKTDQAAVITQYLKMLDESHQALADSGLRLTADIPVWFDTISAVYNGRTRPLSQHVQDLTDRVVLMDYRDMAEGDNGIIQHASCEMLYAMQIGRQVVIGVETNDAAPEPENITFYEEGEQAMKAALATVLETYGRSPAFGGIAIHDYKGYKRLPTGPRVCVVSVSVQINDGEPVAYEEPITITLRAGDVLRLVNLRYCICPEAQPDGVAGEAYLFPHRQETYEYGRFTRGGPIGCGDVGDFEGSWVMEPGQHGLLIALVHYFGNSHDVDDRLYLNLDVGP
jgi:hypothetical protein